MTVSDRIFQLLKEKNMTQKELSNLTGIPQSTISDWKHKKMNPGSDKIMSICEALGVTPYDLLSGAESKKESLKGIDYVVIDKGTDESILIESFRAMSASDKRYLLGYVEAMVRKLK